MALLEQNRKGRTEVDFGAFPGSTHLTHTIGVHGITSDDDVTVWLLPIATDDHTADEASIERIRVSAQPSTNLLTFHLTLEPPLPAPSGSPQPTTYGKWLVAWQF
jgi:hypothetical protein